MELLFLGYEENHLRIMNMIKSKYIMNAVDYESEQLPPNVYIKDIDQVCLDEYKMIFISELLFNNYVDLFKGYHGNAIIFKGISKIKLDELKDTIKINYLMDELKTKQSINRPNVFICGYKHLGSVLSEKLLSTGMHIRVGVTSKDELDNLLKQRIPCIYTTKNDNMALLIESDEFIINTTSNLFSPKVIEKIHNHLIDINYYDIEKEEDYQKKYVPK